MGFWWSRVSTRTMQRSPGFKKWPDPALASQGGRKLLPATELYQMQPLAPFVLNNSASQSRACQPGYAAPADNLWVAQS
eukprot:1155476-Pelagomonas_calceolata.AAC.2